MSRGDSNDSEDLEALLMGENESVPSYITVKTVSPIETLSGEPKVTSSATSHGRHTDFTTSQDLTVPMLTASNKLAALRASHQEGVHQAARSKDQQVRKHKHGLIAKECARRSCFTLATHESKIRPPEDPEIAGSLAHLPFNDGWRSVFGAFKVGEEEPYIKCLSADESFNSFMASHGGDPELVKDYFQMVLQGSQPSARVRQIVRNPPEQATENRNEQLSFFALGQCLRAVPIIFAAMLGEQMKDLSDVRRGRPSEADWSRLLNTAKGLVVQVLDRAKASIRSKYPSVWASLDSGGRDSYRVLIHQCLEEALLDLFEHGLTMFYRGVCESQDARIRSFARNECCTGPPRSVAKKLLDDFNGAPWEKDLEFESVICLFHNALDSIVSPSVRLGMMTAAVQQLGDHGLSSDELLPVMATAFVFGVGRNTRDVNLATTLSIMDDFALPREIRDHGKESYVLAMVMTSLHIISEAAQSSERRLSMASRSIGIARPTANQ